MTVIEIRPHCNDWKVFEAPGVEPVFPKKDQAVNYAHKPSQLSLSPTLHALTPIRDARGSFCSSACRDYVAHPGFCSACIADSTAASAGDTITLNGVGFGFFGARDRCKTCGSVIRAQWFCILFIPIFRAGHYRGKYVTRNSYISRELPKKAKPKTASQLAGRAQ